MPLPPGGGITLLLGGDAAMNTLLSTYDILTSELSLIEKDLKETADILEDLKMQILNPEERETGLLSSRIMRLEERKRVLEELYLRKNIERDNLTR